MTIIADDRTAAQHLTHTVIILATDPGMSGWGAAEGGASYAGWACQPQHANAIESRVRQRGDMQRVRIVGGNYRPGPHCAHLHIYVADVVSPYPLPLTG